MTGALPGFARRIVRWQATHGRHSLPWQATRDPYRVWLSEVMLQQTQVATVLGYYSRFLDAFPNVGALAAASCDDVLALWSGLGYYSRARHLHACAQEVVARFGGEFPRTAQQLETLPGIGRSTAAAIASFCFGERVAILDGNVKRVLARALAFEADMAVVANERELWHQAAQLLPRAPDMPAYTQGLMDLGATVCLPRNPSCLLCPLHEVCRASRTGEPERYPVKTKKLKRTSQSLWLLHARGAAGEVWLQKRPAKGVWGGLYCLPVFDTRDAIDEWLPAAVNARDGEAFLHVLTHKDLHLHPVVAQVPAGWRASEGEWFGAQEWPRVGLPSPIRRLLSAAQ